MTIRRLLRFLTALTVAGAFTVSCSSSGSDETSDGNADSTETSASTTTIAAPILALTGNLDLVEGQCYAKLPPPSTVVDEPTTTTPGGRAQATEPTVPPTLAAPTSTPRPSIVALVDCGEANQGTVYATFCLGPHPEFDDDLTAEPCPGNVEIEYPGDRTIRRAAARICLQRFGERFNEDYATSTKTATEFVPTEGLWRLEDRRVVCLVSTVS